MCQKRTVSRSWRTPGPLADDVHEVGERDVHVGRVEAPAGAEERADGGTRCRPGSRRAVDLEPARVAGALAAGGVEAGVGDPRRRDRAAAAQPGEPEEQRREQRRHRLGSALEPGRAGLTQTTCVPGMRERPNIASGRRPPVEARVGDHAARRGRARRTAGCGGSRRAAVPVRGEHLAAEQDRRHEQAPLRGRPVDHGRQQVLEDVGSPASGRSGRRRARGSSGRGSRARPRARRRRRAAGFACSDGVVSPRFVIWR